MLTALGVLFFLLGFRFMALRYRELSIAERRIRRAAHAAELEFQRGVNVLKQTDDSPESTVRQTDCETCEAQVVQAKSDPPGPSP